MKWNSCVLFFTCIYSTISFAQPENLTHTQIPDTTANVIGQNETINEYFETDDNLNSMPPKLYAQADEPAAKQPSDGTSATKDSSVSSSKDNTNKESAATTTGTVSDPGKSKKKKGSKKQSGESGDSSGHGLQESGAPYKANIGASFEYASESQSKKFSDKTSKTTATTMSLGLGYLMIFGKFEVGPVLSYSNESSKIPEIIDGNYTKKVVTKTGLGGMGVFNIGNIQQDKMLPYVATSILRSSSVDSQTDSSSSTIKITTNITEVAPELGLKFFLGAHLAVNPYFKYILEMSGDEKTEVTGSDATVAAVTGSKMTLGVGLLTYF
jgi:hypothetical protein